MNVRSAGVINAGFKVLGAGLNFLLVPLYIGVYGLRVYGALSLLLSLSQYMSFLDLGFSAALVRESVRVRTVGDQRYFRLKRIAIGLLLGGGGAVTAIAALTSARWGPAVHLDHVDQLWLGVASAGVITVLTLASSCLSSAFVATLRFGHLNAYNLLRNLVPQLACVAAYTKLRGLGPALAVGAMAQCGVVGLQALLLAREERSLVRPALASRAAPLAAFLKDSFGFSAQTLVSSLTMPLLQTVVGARFGSQANGIVDASRRVLFAARGVLEAVFVPVFAHTTRLVEAADRGGLRRLAARVTAASATGALVLYGVLAITLTPLLAAWVGTETGARLEEVAGPLLVGVTFTCPHIGLYYVLAAMSAGRVVNIVAGLLSLLILALGFLPAFQSVRDVVLLYNAAMLAGAIVTLALGFWCLVWLRPAPALSAGAGGADPIETPGVAASGSAGLQ
ncbi:MAG TPA: hypothetical protein VGQ17_11920 [Gemmatimonadales bacterium]|nr:hypothetical protein [Gemmatimonadales bacterium]